MLKQETYKVTVLVFMKKVGKPDCMCRICGEGVEIQPTDTDYYGMKLTVLASGGIKRWVSVMVVLTLGVSSKDYLEGWSKACN